MYKYLFLLSIFVSTTSFADFENLPIRCLPNGINLKKSGSNLEFKTPFDINENSFVHPTTKEAVIFGMKLDDDGKKKKGILDDSKQCRIVADIKVFKRMESEEIRPGDRYHFSVFYPANTNGEHPFQIVFRNGGLDPARVYIECDDLTEDSTVADLEERISDVARITIGENADLSKCQ